MGYTLAFTELRGDNDFLAFAYAWHSYRPTEICHRCFGSSGAADVVWTDMTQSAGWMSPLLSTQDFFDNNALPHRSPICPWPVWSLDVTVNDTTHGMNLGTDQQVAGNCIMDLLEEAQFPVKRHDEFLEGLWHDFKRWESLQIITTSTALFTKVGR